MSERRYKLTQSVARKITPVESYKDLAKHHPSSGREPGRYYETIDDKLEEVRYRDRRVFVKKDFILQNPHGPNYVPAPADGAIKYVGDPTNAIRIVDGSGRMVAQLLHASTLPGRPTSIRRGEPMGIMDDIGSPGSVHVHMEAQPDVFKRYIEGILSGFIAPP